MIITSRKQLRTHLESLPHIRQEISESSEDPDMMYYQLVQLLASGQDGIGRGMPPDFGEEWEPWLQENLDWYIEEAFSIVA